jgi:hypothetical protein
MVLSTAAGLNTAPVILDAAQLPHLDTVRIIGGRRSSSRHDEFETRRLRGEATASFSRADIERRNPASTWQLLSTVRGVQVEQTYLGVVARSRRTPFAGAGGPCYMQVMIDGLMMPVRNQGAFDLVLLPPPDAVFGVEVFAGPSSIPLRTAAPATTSTAD